MTLGQQQWMKYNKTKVIKSAIAKPRKVRLTVVRVGSSRFSLDLSESQKFKMQSNIESRKTKTQEIHDKYLEHLHQSHTTSKQKETRVPHDLKQSLQQAVSFASHVLQYLQAQVGGGGFSKRTLIFEADDDMSWLQH